VHLHQDVLQSISELVPFKTSLNLQGTCRLLHCQTHFSNQQKSEIISLLTKQRVDIGSSTPFYKDHKNFKLKSEFRKKLIQQIPWHDKIYALNKALLMPICEFGIEPAIRVILKFGDPSVEDNLPLRIALHHGHTRIIRLLLSDVRVNVPRENLTGILDFSQMNLQFEVWIRTKKRMSSYCHKIHDFIDSFLTLSIQMTKKKYLMFSSGCSSIVSPPSLTRK